MLYPFRHQLQKGGRVDNGDPTEGLQISEMMVTGNNKVGAAFHGARKVDVVGRVINDGGNTQ